MHSSRTLFALALTAGSLVAAPSSAQDLLTPAAPAKGVTLEGSYSDYEGGAVNFPSTVWFLTGRAPIGGNFSAVVDLPFSYANVETGTETETNSVIGNPYLGIEYAASPRLKLELGTRAPLVSSDEESFADALAFFSNPMRGEAFLDDVVPLTAAATLTQEISPSFSLRARGGATEFFYTGDSDEDSENETSLDYGVAGTYTTGNARFGLGLTGRWIATSDEGSFGDNSVHQAGASADVLFRGVRPGISVRLPLDSDFRDLVNSSIGLYLQVPLR
jgi:hypothetical protein